MVHSVLTGAVAPANDVILAIAIARQRGIKV
jgi:hypothetical protein